MGFEPTTLHLRGGCSTCTQFYTSHNTFCRKRTIPVFNELHVGEHEQPQLRVVSRFQLRILCTTELYRLRMRIMYTTCSPWRQLSTGEHKVKAADVIERVHTELIRISSHSSSSSTIRRFDLFPIVCNYC